MEKKLNLIVTGLFAGVIMLLINLNGQSQSRSVWPSITEQTRPWTRWWWMGSAVDKENISYLLKEYAEAGFGGVEIVPIYGVKGYESRYILYLSPAWMQMLKHTTEQASSLNMGVNISVGTGWPVGGPQVTVEDAASKMIVKRDTLNDSYSITTGKTGQKVKRAAPGGEGFTLDHFSHTAVSNYFKRFDSAFGTGPYRVNAFFNDSYEVYGANWTSNFFEAFKKRRGYDLHTVLNDFFAQTPSAKTARVKSDYRETMADLMRENFVNELSTWAHGKKALSVNQAHGSPGNLLDLYGAVDIAETETFGSTPFPIPGLRREEDVAKDVPDPVMMKFASSAGHAMGHRLTSSETFTWLTEHFKTAWSQCKPEVEQVFLAGINHVFFHGTTYSPKEAVWPGWLFYASVDFVPANSLWPHLKGLNEYITRCQSVLQAGNPDNEIIVYWPVYDAWENPEGLDMPFKVHNASSWLYPTDFYKDIVQLQHAGYSMDFVSDRMIGQAFVKNGNIQITAKGSSHKVLLVPTCRRMPLATLEKINKLAAMGATVVFQELPEDVPGWNNLPERRTAFRGILADLEKKASSRERRIIISQNVQKGLEQAAVYGEALVQSGLKFIRRSIDSGKYYYLVNHTPATIDTIVPLLYAGSRVLIMDPQTGAYGTADTHHAGNEAGIRIQLLPGEAWIIKTAPELPQAPQWEYTLPEREKLILNGPWALRFEKGGPEMPANRELRELVPWTLLADSAAGYFSGTASYTTQVRLRGRMAQDYMLQLGKVYESARVWVNNKEVGTVWSYPFRIRVGKYLKKGNNTIRIEVANLMANRMRYMDIKKIPWKNYHEINFVNINYKDFDASGWKIMPSGLEGPVTLQALRTLP